MKVYFNNSCRICKAEIDLYKKEKIQEIDWVDITNNELAEKETSKNQKDLEKLGLWGVPSFHYKGLSFWGQDRISFLEAIIRFEN